MTDALVMQASKMINDPVLVMQSSTRLNSILFYGEVYTPGPDGELVPVLAALQLTPSRHGYAIDEYKVAGSYARENSKKLPDMTATQWLMITPLCCILIQIKTEPKTGYSLLGYNCRSCRTSMGS